MAVGSAREGKPAWQKFSLRYVVLVVGAAHDGLIGFGAQFFGRDSPAAAFPHYGRQILIIGDEGEATLERSLRNASVTRLIESLRPLSCFSVQFLKSGKDRFVGASI